MSLISKKAPFLKENVVLNAIRCVSKRKIVDLFCVFFFLEDRKKVRARWQKTWNIFSAALSIALALVNNFPCSVYTRRDNEILDLLSDMGKSPYSIGWKCSIYFFTFPPGGCLPGKCSQKEPNKRSILLSHPVFILSSCS